jgi:hypothetical protein
MNNGWSFPRKSFVFFIQTVLLASIVLGMDWFLIQQGITLWVRDILLTILLFTLLLGRKWPPMLVVALIVFVWLITARMQDPADETNSKALIY